MTNSKIIVIVIPAKAGTQSFQALLDPDFRRGDGLGLFHQSAMLKASPAHQYLKSEIP